MAAINHRGVNALTNFEISSYSKNVYGSSSQQQDDSPKSYATPKGELNENKHDDKKIWKMKGNCTS